MGFYRLTVEIRHQRTFQLYKLPKHVAGFIVEQPRHAVGGRAMETAVGA